MAIVVQGLDIEAFNALPGVPTPSPLVEYSQGPVATAFPITSLIFPDSVLSAAFWTFTTGAIGATPALSIAVDWYLATGSIAAANVRFGAQIGVISTGVAQANVGPYSKVLGAAVTVSSAVNTTVAFGTSRAAISVTETVSAVPLFVTAASPAIVFLKVFRDGTDALDTAAGDVKVRKVTVLYQDT